MNTKKSPGAAAGSPYSIQLDDALLEEALAAVEAHRSRPSAASEPPSSASSADDGVEISLEEDSVEAGDPVREDAPTTEAGLNLAAMAAEWERLVAELDQTREERDLARRRLEAEVKERARAKILQTRLSAQVDELKEALLRAEEARRAADAETQRARDDARQATENVARVRDRLRRSEEEARQHGHGPVILSLLPVLENLERASHHVDSSPARVAEGLRMVVEQFRAALARSGVARVEASPGTPFQPAVHEAVTHTPTRDQPAGSVLVELQAGYILNGRLLQAARVAVAAPPATSHHSSLAEGEVLALPDEGSESAEAPAFGVVHDHLDDSVSTSG